jgi:23S rRNA (uracil1939-C5)-methyltransferase
MRPIIGMDHPWRYRNKVEFSVGERDGQLVVGFHPPGRWDRVLPLLECHLLPETTEAVRTTVEEWLRAAGLTPWNPRALTGYARHLAVREARATGEVLVNLVTAPGDLPDVEGLVQLLRTRHPQVVGILHSTNSGTADVATGMPHQTLWGRPYLNERLGDLSLKISADAFFQTNTHMAEILYATAAADAGLTGTEVVWDLYSGIGSIALYLARSARAVLGIELVDSAVRDAHTNAEINGITTATWLKGDARVVLKEVLEGSRRLPADVGRPDVVVVDPPRGGLAHKVIARVAAAEPKRVIYVSCNPSTMAPNITLFQEAGYRLRRVTPIDMFPHTPHIEAVGLLERETAAEREAAAERETLRADEEPGAVAVT